MSFKDLKSTFTISENRRVKVDGIDFPLTLYAPSIDARIGIARGTLQPTEFIAENVADEEGKRMSAADWGRFLIDKPDTANQIIVELSKFGGSDNAEDEVAEAKKP